MYKVGDKVTILPVERLEKSNWYDEKLDEFAGSVMTIRAIDTESWDDACYRMEEDIGYHYGDGFFWQDDMFEIE